jgi:hypothetical protein
MSDITIFDEPSNVATVRRESRRADRMGNSGSNMRRIKLSNGRDFTRVMNGEEIGNAVDQQLDVIIVDWLLEPSRKFYAGAYDKNAKGALPDCWSNEGIVPEVGAKNPQAKSCMECRNNVKGSGSNGTGKACRYERRIAVLVVGDPTGDVYQMAIPGASLFNETDGNGIYSFENYVKKFLKVNREAPDTVVTRIIYDRKAETFKVGFKGVRHLTPVEAKMVDAAQDDPITDSYIRLTVGAVDRPKAIAAPAPVAAIAPPPVEPAVNPFGDADAEPAKRASKTEATFKPKAELASVLSEWGSDEEG